MGPLGGGWGVDGMGPATGFTLVGSTMWGTSVSRDDGLSCPKRQPKGFWSNTDGDLALEVQSGETFVFKSVVAGGYYPISFDKVIGSNASGTTTSTMQVIACF